MKRALYICLLFLVLAAPSATALDSLQTDSLLKVLQKASSDTSRAEILNRLSRSFNDSDLKLSLDYALQALEISMKNGYTKGIAAAHENAGFSYYYQNDLEKGHYHFLKALEAFEKLKDDFWIAECCNFIGKILRQRKNFTEAERYALRSLGLMEKLGKKRHTSIALNGLANIYYEQKKFDKALEFYRKRLVIETALGSKRGISNSLGNIGGVYMELGQIDKALHYHLLAYNYLQKEEKFASSRYFQKAAGSMLSQIADLYLRKKDYGKALDYALQGLKINDRVDAGREKLTSYRVLADIYFARNNSSMARLYSQKHNILKDSLFSEESQKQINELQTRFETEKKEKEIQLLSHQKSLQELEIRKQKNEKSGLIAFFGIITVLSYAGYRNYSLKQKVRLDQELIRQEKLRLQAILSAQEEERKRISAELHDGVGQILATARLNLSSVQSSTEDLRLSATLQLLDTGCTELRNISHNLMPSVLIKAGLSSAVRELADKINISGVLKIYFDSEPGNKQLSETAEVHVFRIVQELLSNIIKYADARSVHIQISVQEEFLTLMIEDDGKGFDKSILRHSSGNGWANIQGRLELLKGKAEIDSRPGKGTVLFIEIPLNNV